jgi:hypothetical protein
MEIISRRDASDKGLKRFFTGKPCKRGHLRERNVKTGACLGCLAHYAKEWSKKYNDDALGFEKVESFVHADDVAILHDFVTLLRAARINGTPVPMVPMAEHVATVNTMIQMMQPVQVAPPPAPTTTDKRAMWVRIHGQEIADQMRDSGL